MRSRMMLVVRIVLALLLAHVSLAATPCEDVVCVDVENKSGAVTFYAVSRFDGVTVTFSVSALNMKPSSPPVLTKTLARGRTELLTLTAVPGKKFSYEHAFFWEWGVPNAAHDDRVSYRLPFEPGNECRLYQGPNGALSHQGKFAFDFTMPRGTPVCAARGGVVTAVVDAFDEGGADVKFLDMANTVNVVHADGTLAEYVHLLRGAMRVKVGDPVEAGTVLGLSGNSGYSTGPHLHFEVWRWSKTASLRETLPVKFLVGGKAAVV